MDEKNPWVASILFVFKKLFLPVLGCLAILGMLAGLSPFWSGEGETTSAWMLWGPIVLTGGFIFFLIFGRYRSEKKLLKAVQSSKSFETALREGESRYRRLAESNIIGLIETDLRGRILEANEAFLSLIGYQEEDLPLEWKAITPPEWHRAGSRALDQVKESGVIAPWEKEFFQKDGSRVPVLIGTAQLDGKRNRCINFVLELTNRLQAEKQREHYFQELRRSNAELEQFAYVASHDLQEPLRMIVSYLQLLDRRYKGELDDAAAEFIDFAVDGANRMKGLLNDLLSYSRVGTRGKTFAPVNCSECLDAALSNLKLAIEESGVHVYCEPLPTFTADSMQLTQLFQNLVGNAIKFKSENPPEIDIQAITQKEGWLFSVKDNGIGIDPRHKDRIFLVFQRLQTREDYPGTGIGLAICKKIVERHGGRIWVESANGEGSTFYFTLPEKGYETE